MQTLNQHTYLVSNLGLNVSPGLPAVGPESGVTVWETETPTMQDCGPHCSPSFYMHTVTAWDPRWAGTEGVCGGCGPSCLHSG